MRTKKKPTDQDDAIRKALRTLGISIWTVHHLAESHARISVKVDGQYFFTDEDSKVAQLRAKIFFRFGFKPTKQELLDVIEGYAKCGVIS